MGGKFLLELGSALNGIRRYFEDREHKPSPVFFTTSPR